MAVKEETEPRYPHRFAGRRRWLVSTAAAMLLGWAAVTAAELSPATAQAPIAAAATRRKPGVLVLFNRPIMVMRATVVDNAPEERARLASERLRGLTAHKPIGPITALAMEEGTAIRVGDDVAFLIAPGDLDRIGQETMDEAVATVIQRLQSAIAAIEEQRSLPYVVRAVALSLGAVLMAAGMLWGLLRLEKMLLPALRRESAHFAARFVGTGFAVASYAAQRITWPIRLAFWFLHALIAYLCLTFCLGRFPYTRIWSRTMGGHIVAIVSGLVQAVVEWLPDLLVIAIIATVTRVLVRLVQGVFRDIEEGRLKVTWCDPLTARPTARILGTILWLFALVMIYPYLPGSDSAAFKGVSVFVGLLVSLGASGVIGQVVGGFVLMYSRALEPGDYVRIGEDEGVVEEIGFLSTTIRTPRVEKINVPNALLLSATSKDYSALAGADGVILPATVTIGYSTPWRQVHAMLQEAAARTPAVCGPPEPFVLQTALSDAYVEYQLNVFLKTPSQRMRVLSALHANILDVFNEYGVQIMSPHYEADPPEKVWVPKDKWFAAPALPPERTAAPDAAPKASRAAE